jgi:hypothetical protein
MKIPFFLCRGKLFKCKFFSFATREKLLLLHEINLIFQELRFFDFKKGKKLYDEQNTYNVCFYNKKDEEGGELRRARQRERLMRKLEINGKI